MEACLELCRLNSKDRFPHDTVTVFEEDLRGEIIHYMVMEHDGRIIASGGYYLRNLDYVTFAYGLVHPDYQGQGLGRVLFFARLAMLPIIQAATCIHICAVQKSLPYYQKLGFAEISENWVDNQGNSHPNAMLSVNAFLIGCAWQYLEKTGIPFPDLRPLHSKDLVLYTEREPPVEIPEECLSPLSEIPALDNKNGGEVNLPA